MAIPQTQNGITQKKQMKNICTKEQHPKIQIEIPSTKE